MRLFKILSLPLLSVLFLISSCSALQHGDDPNYSLCKSLEGKIQFGGDTSYQPAAQSEDVDKERLQMTYDKLNCQKYQSLRFW